MRKKPFEKFKEECGKIAITIEGDYTIIIDKGLNKFKYHTMIYDVHIHNKNDIITIYVYKKSS
jgi:hypothetical protein